MKEKKILAFERPDLLKEWDYERNVSICAPDEVTIGSNKKVWWIFPFDDKKTGKHFDFRWQAKITHRVKGSGCPFLNNKAVWPGYNDLLTTNPELAVEWNYEKNRSLNPNEVTAGSNKKVWWKCRLCGDEWEAQINQRTGNNSNCCPKCARKQSYITRHQNKIKSGKTVLELFPEIAAEWDYDKNTPLTPNDVTPADHRIVWWKCNRCGFSWKAKIANRTYLGNGCQRCAKRFQSSFPEQAIYYYLKQLFTDTISSDNHLGIELDVYIPSKNIAVEYDGEKWHNSKERVLYDNKKNHICIENQILLFRIRESGNEMLDSIDNKYIKVIDCKRKDEKSLTLAIRDLLNIIEPTHDLKIDLSKDRGKIKSMYIQTAEQNSLAVSHPEIAAEWDYERNKPFTPDKITKGSDDKFYWICPKCSKSYSASVAHRTIDKTSCPYCAKQKVVTGVTDLKTWCKDNGQEILLQEWDYEKNIDISPGTVFKGSNQKVWWKCSKCGYSWETRLYSRTGKRHKNGCPSCREENRKYNHMVKIINEDTGEMFDSIKEAAAKYGCTTATISNNLRGKTKSALGYHWKYVNKS